MVGNCCGIPGLKQVIVDDGCRAGLADNGSDTVRADDSVANLPKIGWVAVVEYLRLLVLSAR